MNKEDWYFATSVALGVFAILGLDWKLVLGRVARHPSKGKYFLVLTALFASVTTSVLGLRQASKLGVYKAVPQHKLILIYGREFQNERVELDGKDFEHCKFNQVTLVLRGRTNFVLRENTFSGSLWIDAASEPASQLVALMKGLGLINKNIEVKERSSSQGDGTEIKTD